MKRPSLAAVVPTGWRSADPSERREAVNTAFVERARLKGITDAMDKLRRGFREKAATKCMVVVGEPGVGKSTLLERYRDDARVPEIVTDTHVRRPRPVIYVELPSDATVNVSSDAILSEIMGQPMHSNGRSKEGMLETQLRVHEVELIILDDFQHAASRGREKTQSVTADFVKSITKRSRIPVVMAGLPELSGMIVGNDQLRTITPYRFAIPRYGFGTALEKKAFRSFLADLDGLLPLDQRTGLDEDERSTALHLACGGLLRPLNHLVVDAAAMAIDAGASCIRDRDLHASWQAGNRDASSKTNPFERLASA